jgi:pimeloyl-ACP methyl ester carboxylesterase
MTDMLTLIDGRKVSYADYGEPGQTAVLWCHGGPGNRLEPSAAAPGARASGFRLIGVDRPGYGDSTPVPGRNIGDWAKDGLAVADHLAIDRFLAVGVSTGGAYALALAASSPRVVGVIACCAVTDMRWSEGKAMMPFNLPIWNASSRGEAIRLAEEQFGPDGSKMAGLMTTVAFPPADLAVLTSPAFLNGAVASSQASFAQGVVGYADDRIADGRGWGSFALEAIRCPAIVLHGDADPLVPLAHGQHTAGIVPGARLEVHAGQGHFSIGNFILPALEALSGRARV